MRPHILRPAIVRRALFVFLAFACALSPVKANPVVAIPTVPVAIGALLTAAAAHGLITQGQASQMRGFLGTKILTHGSIDPENTPTDQEILFKIMQVMPQVLMSAATGSPIGKNCASGSTTSETKDPCEEKSDYHKCCRDYVQGFKNRAIQSFRKCFGKIQPMIRPALSGKGTIIGPPANLRGPDSESLSVRIMDPGAAEERPCGYVRMRDRAGNNTDASGKAFYNPAKSVRYNQTHIPIWEKVVFPWEMDQICAKK